MRDLPSSSTMRRFQKYYSATSSSGSSWPEVQSALDKWRADSAAQGERQQAIDILAKLWDFFSHEGEAVLGVWEDTLWKLHLLSHAFLVPPSIIRRTCGQVVNAGDILCQIISEPVASKANDTRGRAALRSDSNVALMVFFGMSLGSHHVLPCQVVLMPAAEVSPPTRKQCAGRKASPTLANQAV
eukprot:jgi/Chlat1/4746/Chrsp308S04735